MSGVFSSPAATMYMHSYVSLYIKNLTDLLNSEEMKDSPLRQNVADLASQLARYKPVFQIGTKEDQESYIRELSAHHLVAETLRRMGSKSKLLFGVKSLWNKGWDRLKFIRFNEVLQNYILEDVRFKQVEAEESLQNRYYDLKRLR